MKKIQMLNKCTWGKGKAHWEHSKQTVKKKMTSKGKGGRVNEDQNQNQNCDTLCVFIIGQCVYAAALWRTGSISDLDTGGESLLDMDGECDIPKHK